MGLVRIHGHAISTLCPKFHMGVVGTHGNPTCMQVALPTKGQTPKVIILR